MSKQDVYNPHCLSNDEKTTCDTLKYMWHANDIGHSSHAQINNTISKHGITRKCSVGEYLKFIKPQVQGTLLCTWGVVHREL